MSKYVFHVGFCKPTAALPSSLQLSLQMLLVDTGRELETMCSRDVHPLKMLYALLELCFGRTWFLFEFSCQLASSQCFREESALQKHSNLKKESMFHFESILLHHVQIEAIPVVQMGFGCFSLGIAWQLCEEVFCLVTASNLPFETPRECLSLTGEQTEHRNCFLGIEPHHSQPFPEVSHPLAQLIHLLLIWEVSMQRIVPCRNRNVSLRGGQCRFVAWAKL